MNINYYQKKYFSVVQESRDTNGNYKFTKNVTASKLEICIQYKNNGLFSDN